MAIATLHEISGGRAALGIGAGVSGFQELGINAERSAVAIREAVELIRQLLAGQNVTVKGQQVSINGGRLGFAPPQAEIPIYVASQREAGCRVAGRVADGAIMQGCVAEPLLSFFRQAVAEGAQRVGRDPAQVELVARINVCIADDVHAARSAMRSTIVRSLVAQRPDFFTFRTAGLELPEPLRAQVRDLPYTHDVAPLMKVAPLVPDAFVDAVTLAGSAAQVAKGVTRLVRSGIGQLVVYPVASQGSIVSTIEQFQTEVMPAVRTELERS